MKLLIVTQKVDEHDPILGFFCRWIEEFAKQCEHVTVICLEEGRHALPHNVTVYSLGKEEGASRVQYGFRFYQLIWKLRKEYDTIFVHMNPEYSVLGGWLWRMLGKKIGLWYVHRHVNMKLKIAEMFANDIFTSTKESFGIPSKKVHYVGHGIDVQRFTDIPPAVYEPLSVVHIGRITRIKHIEVIIRAIRELLDQNTGTMLKLVGETVTRSDRVYQEELKSLIKELGIGRSVVWEGAMVNTDALAQASITVNAAPDGGMDKAVLESLAAGRAVFASNRAFGEVFGPYADTFLYREKDSIDLARKIGLFLQGDTTTNVGVLLEKVRNMYAITTLIRKLVSTMNHA